MYAWKVEYALHPKTHHLIRTNKENHHNSFLFVSVINLEKVISNYNYFQIVYIYLPFFAS